MRAHKVSLMFDDHSDRGKALQQITDGKKWNNDSAQQQYMQVQAIRCGGCGWDEWHVQVIDGGTGGRHGPRPPLFFWAGLASPVLNHF